MKIVKPKQLSVLTRPFARARERFLGVSVLAFVPLGEVDALLSEAQMWSFAAARLGSNLALDVAIPKARSEFLIDARAHGPNGQAHARLPVAARVGDLSKVLTVHRDRWQLADGSIVEAEPFTVMALDWSRAHGGPGCATNPLGRGQAWLEHEGRQLRLLPNVEGDEPDMPAGFGPIDASWAQRRTLSGTHDQDWLEHAFPGFPADIDWGFFNLAPHDQQRDEPWRSGEPYCFDNLHPTRPRSSGRLPNFVARAFVTRGPGVVRRGLDEPALTASELEAELEEVPLRLQTLWFFPDAERAILVFHGATPIASHDGSDVRHLLVAAEADDPESWRARRYYAAALARRLDRSKGVVATLDDDELLPAGLAGVSDGEREGEALRKQSNLRAWNLHRKATREHQRVVAELRERGVPSEAHPPAPVPPRATPSLDELPRFVDAMMADVVGRRAREQARLDGVRRRTSERLAAAGIDRGLVEDDRSDAPLGVPRFRASEQRAALYAAIGRCRAQGVSAAGFEAMLTDTQLQARWDQAERDAWTQYRRSAHLQRPVPRRSPSQSLAAALALRQALASETGELARLDLSGADLGAIDLRGADLRGALLEAACLDGADLRGARLDDAVLAHASLRGAHLDGCALERTNLGKADLRGASLSRARLHQTVLAGAELSRASLRGAELVEVELRDACLREAVLDQLQAERLSFYELDVRGASLRGAELGRSTFVGLDLRGVDLREAGLERVAFVRCRLGGAQLDGASLGRAVFVEGCVLDGASMCGASLSRCNLRGSTMTRCDLDGADLDAADLSGCALVGARLSLVRAHATRFDGADLRGADLRGANCLGASFGAANLDAADLRDANLHGADLGLARGISTMVLDDALLTAMCVHPRAEQPLHLEVDHARA